MKNTGTLYRSTDKTPTVFPEFRDLLPPLSLEQQEALEKDIWQNGCYSPLIVDQELRVVDGHNRLSICQGHEIPYTMLVFEFEDALEAKQWALDTQKGRRNPDNWELGKIALKLKPDVEARAKKNMSAGGQAYLYILGKIEKRQYPPRVTGKMRQDVMRFEQLRAQFQFLNEHGISGEADMTAFVEKAEVKIKSLTKRRTILNVQKKKRQPLFQALTNEEVLAPAKRLYNQGHSGMEAEAQQYLNAVKLLDSCGESREALSQQQSELYTKLADLNRELR